MTNVYNSRVMFMINVVITLALIVFPFFYPVQFADTQTTVVVLIVLLLWLGFFIWDAIRAFAFPSWAYDENGFVKYGFLSSDVVRESKWSQVEEIHNSIESQNVNGNRSYANRYLKTYDGTIIKLTNIANIEQVVGDVVSYVRKNNPNARIDSGL